MKLLEQQLGLQKDQEVFNRDRVSQNDKYMKFFTLKEAGVPAHIAASQAGMELPGYDRVVTIQPPVGNTPEERLQDFLFKLEQRGVDPNDAAAVQENADYYGVDMGPRTVAYARKDLKGNVPVMQPKPFDTMNNAAIWLHHWFNGTDPYAEAEVSNQQMPAFNRYRPQPNALQQFMRPRQ